MIETTVTMDQISITRVSVALPHVEIPEALRQKIAKDLDEAFMRAALHPFGDPVPTTLYVDKYGHYSTVNPNAPRPRRGWLDVSS